MDGDSLPGTKGAAPAPGEEGGAAPGEEHAAAPVVFFPTCVVDAVTPQAGMAAARVLQRAGLTVEVPEGATCCGQPAWNAGHAEPAAEVARTALQALAATDGDIVVPAGSCATMIRLFWRELFHLEGTPQEQELAATVASRTYEFSEYLHARDLPPRQAPDPTPTAYHRSCHMLHELGIDREPQELLGAAAADVRPVPAEARCCGFGGLFAVKLPEVSVAMADEVLDGYVATGAKQVVGCDASCLLHLEGRAARRGLELEFRHLAELLDDAPGAEP